MSRNSPERFFVMDLGGTGIRPDQIAMGVYVGSGVWQNRQTGLFDEEVLIRCFIKSWMVCSFVDFV